ncbi:hypothetical protein GLOIN_2v1846419 [Rhizophagus irregularis DAOM 181602=DAOM 197198]|nr:hypothetical protein GLOIN_2v1846419 [Rhizophagus irregularis DAOM 181602=DAOM 197198]
MSSIIELLNIDDYNKEDLIADLRVSQMSKKCHFTSKLLGIGLISPILHYGIFAQDWWKTISLNSKDKNIVFTVPFRLYMRVSCFLNGKDFIITVLQNNENEYKPAINSCYKEVFGTKTEYSGMAVIGFEDEKIIQQLLDKIEFFLIFLQIEKLSVVISGLGYSSKDGYYGAGEDFTSSFITRYQNSQHLFLLKLEDNQCILEIYHNANKIEQFTESMPNDVWKKVGIHKKFSESYLFRITHETTQNLLQFEVAICKPDEWNNYEKLTKVTSSTITDARKYAKLYGLGAPPINKIKRKVQCLSNAQEEQFTIFFQDRENVTMSSYYIDVKTGLPVLYLRD